MAKKKLAFVDHNYHKKTRSGDFLREIFSEDFIIEDFWWSLKEENNLIKDLKKYENIFFFQTLIPRYDLLKLKDKNFYTKNKIKRLIYLSSKESIIDLLLFTIRFVHSHIKFSDSFFSKTPGSNPDSTKI